MARDKNNSTIFDGGLRARLPFLFYCMLSIVLMLIDNRFSFSQYIHKQTSALLSPVWWLAGRPYVFWQLASDAVQTNQSLHQQVKVADQKQLKTDLALQKLGLLQAENNEFRALLNAQQRIAPAARLVELISVSPEPNQKHFVINHGANQGAKVGQVVIDANGLAGQVVEVFAGTSVVIAITDADHAIPIMVTRSGFRSIVFGQGNDRNLALSNLTPSDDVKVGDILVTSGVGGRFPPGIPVGVVKAFRQDAVMTFLNAQITPFARLGYGRHLLLLQENLQPKAKAILPTASSTKTPAATLQAPPKIVEKTPDAKSEVKP